MTRSTFLRNTRRALLGFTLGLLAPSCDQKQCVEGDACICEDDCSEACEGAGCGFTCEAGASCDFSCPDGNCSVTCESGSDCNLDCEGGGCSMACTEGASCHIDECAGGACTLACGGSDDCDNACGVAQGCVSD